MDAYQIYKSGPVIFEKNIETYYGLNIPHNTIYRMMLMHQMVIENPRRKIRENGSGLNENIPFLSGRVTGKNLSSRDRKNGLLLSSISSRLLSC
jgi:hypothetical protein